MTTKRSRIQEIVINNGLPNHPVKAKKLKQPHSPEELFKLHTLCAFIGSRGSGKTHAMINLARRYLEEGSFTRVFIMSPTYESNPIFHVLKINPKDVYSNLHTSQADIIDILSKTKDDSDEYDSYEEYLKAWKRWKKGKELTLDQRTMLENNNGESPPYVPRPSPLLIIDDMSHSDIYSTSKHNPFINLCLRHRHINHGKGITIFMAAQTFRSGIPLALRQNIQQYFLFPTRDQDQLESIYHEVANIVDHDTFMKIYEQATHEKHAFLTIDTGGTKHSQQFRRNFNTYLKVHHLDSEDESL